MTAPCQAGQPRHENRCTYCGATGVEPCRGTPMTAPTPALRRAADALVGWKGLTADADEYRRRQARAALAAALGGETIAEVLELHYDLVWQEPAEVFECVGCDFRVPGDEVEARTIRWHQADMIRAEVLGDDAGEADAGLVLVLLGTLVAVLLGVGVVALAAGVFG